MNHPLTYFAIACLTVAANAPSNAMAESNTSNTAGTPDEARGPQNKEVLQEIIVTATKRAEAAQDIPMTITAVSGESLEQSGITDTQYLSMEVPALQISDNTTISNISIRGVNSGGVAGSAPNSAVYVDGVYLYEGDEFISALMDIKQVEVLEGPQSVLWGRNATGGTILIESAEPGDELASNVNLQLGNYSYSRVTGAVDIPIIDNILLMRVFGAAAHDDGTTKNVTNPNDHPGQIDYQYGRVTLKYLPTSSLDVTLRAYIRSQGGAGFDPIKAIDPAAFGSAYTSTDPRQTSSNVATYEPIRSFGSNLHVHWDMGWGTLTSITGWTYFHEGPDVYDVDSTEVPYFSVGVAGSPDLGLIHLGKQVSEEAYLTGDIHSLNWLVGGSYTHESDVGNDHDEFGTTILTYGPAGTFTTAWAGYAQLNYAILQNLTASAGARITTERVSQLQTSYEPYLHFKGSATTPAYSLKYKLSNDINVYASLSKGYRSGGYNDAVGLPEIKPSYVTSYELGAKTSWFDSRLQVNGDIYRYNYKDEQISVLAITASGIQGVTENAGASHGEGVEFTLHALPARGFRIDLGTSFSTTLFDKYNTGSANYAGNRAPFAPKATATLGVSYETPQASWGSLTPQLDYRYTGLQYFEVTNTTTPGLYQGGYSWVNGRLTYKDRPDAPWNVSAYVTNLFDKVVYSQGVDLGAPNQTIVFLQQPRKFGLEVDAHF